MKPPFMVKIREMGLGGALKPTFGDLPPKKTSTNDPLPPRFGLNLGKMGSGEPRNHHLPTSLPQTPLKPPLPPGFGVNSGENGSGGARNRPYLLPPGVTGRPLHPGPQGPPGADPPPAQHQGRQLGQRHHHRMPGGGGTRGALKPPLISRESPETGKIWQGEPQNCPKFPGGVLETAASARTHSVSRSKASANRVGSLKFGRGVAWGWPRPLRHVAPPPPAPTSVAGRGPGAASAPKVDGGAEPRPAGAPGGAPKPTKFRWRSPEILG